MLRPISLLLAGMLAAMPTASLAAEPEQIDCPLEGLSAAELDALAENAASVGPPSDPSRQRFHEVVGQCSSRHGWSPDETTSASIYNLSMAGTTRLRRQFTGFGISLEEIEAIALADAPFRAAARSGQVDDAAIGAFVQRNLAAIERTLAGQPNPHERGVLLGRFLLYRIMMDVARERFAGQ